MVQLTKTYRLIWDAKTQVIRCCDEFPAGTITTTNNPAFEADTFEEIQTKIQAESLIIPDDLENSCNPHPTD